MANAGSGGQAEATYDPIDLKRSILLLYASVGLPLAIIGYPIAIWIPPRYADAELGLTLPIIGTILILARLSDIITDPLVGNLSDNRPTRWGRRKPWILAGVPVMCLGIYMLFMPPAGAGLHAHSSMNATAGPRSDRSGVMVDMIDRVISLAVRSVVWS